MLNDGATYLPTGGEGHVPLWDGTYAATVVNNDDPLGVGRLQLNVPQVLGNSVSAWAVPLGTYYTIPNNGTTVSATFIGGDPAQPAWIGPLDLAPVVIAGTTRVTYSATAPSSPAVGDIWYQIIGGVQAPPQVWTFNSGTSTFSWVTKPSLGTSAIGTGQVTGTNIAANTITARNINVGNSLNPNPYFGGGDISNWTAFATTGTAPVFTGVATTGGFGYPYAGNVAAVAGSSFPGISSTNFAVNAGDPVQVNGWFNTNATLQFTISYFNSVGSFIGQTPVNVGASAGNWQYMAINGNAIAGAVTANLTVKVNTGSAAGTEVFQATGLTVQTKLNGGIITAGTITALQIAAQTITADQLAVTGNSLANPNPYFSGGSIASYGVFNGTLTAVQPGGSAFYPWAGKFTSNGTTTNGGINGFGSGTTGVVFACAPGNGVNIFAKVYATQPNMSIQVQWYTANFGAFISQTFLSTPVTINTWTDISWIATPPATAAIGVPIIQMNATSGNLSSSDFFYVSGFTVLTSIDGGIINAGTINTAQLNAAAITGMTITGNTINGGTINGATFNGTNWIENAKGQYFYTGVPQQTSISSTTTGGTVLAGTYLVSVAYVNATGESGPSTPNSITTTGSTSTFTITSPVAAGNATGWYAYVSPAGGGTQHRQQTAGSPTAIGTSLTLTAPPTTGGVAPPGPTGTGLNTPAFGNMSMAITPLGGNDTFGNNVTKIGFLSQTPDGVTQTQVAAGTVNVTQATNAGASVGPAGFVTGTVNINGNTSVISGATIVTPGVATPTGSVSSATYYASATGFPLALASNDGNVYDLGTAVHDTFVTQTISSTSFVTVNGSTFNVLSGQRYKFEAFVVYHGSQNAGAPILSFAHPNTNTYTSVAAHEEWSVSGSAPAQTNTDISFLDVTGPTMSTGRFCYQAVGFFQPSANQTFTLAAACTVAADTWVIDAAMVQLTPLT